MKSFSHLRPLLGLLLAAPAGLLAANQEVRATSRTTVNPTSVVPVSPVPSNYVNPGSPNYYETGYQDYDYKAVTSTAAAVNAAVATNTMVMGTVLYTPPSAYIITIVNGITYYKAAGNWYQPQFNGSTTIYVIVPAPAGSP
jgi:hypothetical protein